jgi:hypothetical protein
MLTAAALLAENRVPGMWVILTGWNPEPVLDRPGSAAANGSRPPLSVCSAVALALTADRPGRAGPRLRIAPPSAAPPPGARDRPAFSTEALLESLAAPGRARHAWALGCGGWVELDK